MPVFRDNLAISLGKDELGRWSHSWRWSLHEDDRQRLLEVTLYLQGNDNIDGVEFDWEADANFNPDLNFRKRRLLTGTGLEQSLVSVPAVNDILSVKCSVADRTQERGIWSARQYWTA